MNIKLTVITVVKNLIKNNRRDFFIQCAHSVKNQTYKNIEHIIIDGDSSDGTLDLINDLGLRYISQKDCGVYEAMNTGIKMASGEYIIFINSDDFFCSSDSVEIAMKNIIDAEVDFCLASCNIIDPIFANKNRVLRPNIYRIFNRMPASHQAIFCKKSCFKKYGYFNIKYKISADFDFLLRLFIGGATYIQIKNILTTYRLGGLSDILRRRTHREAASVIYDNFKKYIPDITLENSNKILIRNFISLTMLKKLTRRRLRKERLLFYLYHVKERLKFHKRNLFLVRSFKNGLVIKIMGIKFNL